MKSYMNCILSKFAIMVLMPKSCGGEALRDDSKNGCVDKEERKNLDKQFL